MCDEFLFIIQKLKVFYYCQPTIMYCIVVLLWAKWPPKDNRTKLGLRLHHHQTVLVFADWI